ncbi:MAG: ATP-dependent DNA helicase RecG [Eubacterium sp.]
MPKMSGSTNHIHKKENKNELTMMTPLSQLKGIGPKKAAALKELGAETAGDLLYILPRRYEDRRQPLPIAELKPGKDQLIEGSVVSRRFSGFRRGGKSPLVVLIQDNSGLIEIVFFSGSYITNLFKVGEMFSFFGRVSENRGQLQMVHPEFHRLHEPGDVRGILPVYPLSKGLTQKDMGKLLETAKPLMEEADWLPEAVREKHRLADLPFALKNIHWPGSERKLLEGRYRLVFDEFLTLELGLKMAKSKSGQEKHGAVIRPEAGDAFIASLPFSLTEGQMRTWKEIGRDLQSELPMNRLVQGDVGSGKTVVAEAAMYAAVKSGYQAVMMAPTGILARQHAQTFKRDFEPLGIRTALLHGGMSAAARRELLQQLADGEIDMLIGTHAVIQPDVKFFHLGLVVTDEQHRFGVGQRKMLSSKGTAPNILVMTATPIPRTLAVILYGDQDISIIDTLPSGRKPVKTFAVSSSQRDQVYDKLKEELAAGRQAYAVAPFIEDSDQMEGMSAQRLYEEMQKRFPDFRVGLLHGGMDAEQKEQIMTDFAEKKIDLLVSTVVIEVGIDVPNATVMVIENAERFGLAQMHQLRGRVGRGSEQAYCFLIVDQETEIAKRRAEIMARCSDGFQIAEDDLILRGPGELFGTRQHGLPELKIADLGRHQKVLKAAEETAEEILRDDPELEKEENQSVREKVENMFHGDARLEI